MRLTLSVVGLGLILSLLACKKGSASTSDAGAASASAETPSAATPSKPADPDAAIKRLAEGDKTAESELVAMGKSAVTPLGAWMSAQDDKVEAAEKSKRWGLIQPLLRAIAVCQQIGADAEPALMLLHKHTKNSATRTYTCAALRKIGSTCPAGER
jgi:hypothetical protein